MDMSSDFEDVPLPPAQVTVAYRQTGGSAFMAVAVTLALAPFVQAVAASLGSKLAEAIDENARDAVRRLLGRARQQPGIPTAPQGFDRRISVALVDEDPGIRVSLPDSLPAEAVVQLLKMPRAGSHQVRGLALWLPEGARDGRWFVESEGRLEWAWDAVNDRWRSAE